MANMAKKSVLFVCLGNICRSPIAEAVLTNLVTEKGEAEKWYIDSAGTGDWHIGNPPDKRGRNCLKTHGITTSHKARQVRADDFQKFDFIFGMDENNMSDLKDIQPANSKCILEMLGEYDPQGRQIVQDPYYGGDDGFESVYQQCLRCCKKFLEKHS